MENLIDIMVMKDKTVVVTYEIDGFVEKDETWFGDVYIAELMSDDEFQDLVDETIFDYWEELGIDSVYQIWVELESESRFNLYESYRQERLIYAW